MPRSSRRRSTPVSPAKTRTEATSPRQTRKAARTRSYEPSAGTDTNKEHVNRALDAVQEEGDSILVRDAQTTRGHTLPQKSPPAEHDGQHSRTARRVRSIRASVYNDIAQTDLKIDSTIKHLAELDFRADEILSQLDLYSKPQLLDRLGDHESQAWEDFSEDATRLESERQHFCTDTDFLQIDELVGRLAAIGLPTKGASHVYMKANLALFFYRLIEAHPVELHNLLITLSALQTFPEIFSSIVAPGTDDTVRYDEDFQIQTTSLGLDILTQSFIFRAKRSVRDQKFDYTGALKDVFTEDGGDLRDVSLGHPSRIDSTAYTKSVRETMSEIMRVISKKAKISTNIAALEEKYPWTEFMGHALAWVQTRAEQLNDDIQRAGGARAIKHGLLQSNSQPSPKVNRKRSRTSKADEDFAGKVSFLKNVDDELNAGETESQQDEDEDSQRYETAQTGPDAEHEPLEEAQAPSQSNRVLREIIPRSVPESPQTQGRHQDASQSQDQDQNQDQPSLINDDQPVEEEIPDSAQSPSTHSVIKPTVATTTVLRNLQRQTKEGNKENSPPARPIHTTGLQTTAPRATSSTAAPTQTLDKGKRRREEDRDEDSEDDEDDFESDRRHAKHPRPDISRKWPPIRQDQPTSSTAYLANTVEHNDQLPTRTTRHPPASTQPPPHRSTSSQPPHSTRLPSSTAPPPSSYEAYQDAHRNARSNTAFATSLAPTPTFPRPPQSRRPWTAPEIERLLYLMRQYGCAWSTIKKADERMTEPQLLERSQVQLKDKARNMKLDFLKAEMELPGELVAVTISKGHKEMLRSMNIAFPGEENEE